MNCFVSVGANLYDILIEKNVKELLQVVLEYIQCLCFNSVCVIVIMDVCTYVCIFVKF